MCVAMCDDADGVVGVGAVYGVVVVVVVVDVDGGLCVIGLL